MRLILLVTGLGDWRWAADKYSCNLVNKAKGLRSLMIHDSGDSARAHADGPQHELPAGTLQLSSLTIIAVSGRP